MCNGTVQFRLLNSTTFLIFYIYTYILTDLCSLITLGSYFNNLVAKKDCKISSHLIYFFFFFSNYLILKKTTYS
ncbi:hypothetical protein BY996DRAFT_7145811 [Phakopsora pachyrhizi]|nr:hypothetical protein BY996DRAFT_7145811 [Phakopsora pachyrhizi]